MPQYLNSFTGVLKNIQTRQILKLLNQKKATGEIRSLEEFSDEIQTLIRDLTSETMKPSLSLYYAEEDELTSSQSLNFMLERVQDDLESSFAEALKISEVQSAHESIIKDVILKNLRAGISELETKISMYEFMNSTNHGFSHGLFSTFRESQENRTNRSSEAQNRTLFIDPRTNKFINKALDATVEGIGERLILANSDQEYWKIKAARVLFDSETPTGDLITSPPANSINQIIDNTKGTYWIQNFSFRNKQNYVKAKVEVDLGIIQEINFIEIEPATSKGVILEAVHYLDGNNVVQNLNLPERILEGPASINIQTVSTNRLIFTFRTENGKSVGFLVDTEVAGITPPSPTPDNFAFGTHYPSITNMQQYANGYLFANSTDSGSDNDIGDPVEPNSQERRSDNSLTTMHVFPTYKDIKNIINELSINHPNESSVLANGISGGTQQAYSVIEAGYNTSNQMQSVATQNIVKFYKKELTYTERKALNSKIDTLTEEIILAVGDKAGDLFTDQHVAQSDTRLKTQTVLEVQIEDTITQYVQAHLTSNTLDVTVQQILAFANQTKDPLSESSSLMGVTNTGTMQGVAPLNIDDPTVVANTLINGSSSIYPDKFKANEIFDEEPSGDIEAPFTLVANATQPFKDYQTIANSHSVTNANLSKQQQTINAMGADNKSILLANTPSVSDNLSATFGYHPSVDTEVAKTVGSPIAGFNAGDSIQNTLPPSQNLFTTNTDVVTPPNYQTNPDIQTVFSGYDYQIGLDNIKVGRTNYTNKSIYVSQPLTVCGAGLLGLKVVEARPYNEPDQQVISYTNDTYDISTIDTNSFLHGSIEYWIIRQDFGSKNQLVKTTRFPILPVGVDRVYHERLVLFDKSTTTRLNNDIGLLNFFAIRSESDIKVYRNGVLIVDATDEAVPNEGWVRDTDSPSNDTPDNIIPMKFKIKVINPLLGDIYTVSYTPVLSTTNTLPNTLTQFTASSGLQITDLVGDLSAFVSEEQVVNLTRIEKDETLKTDLFLVIVLRRNTAEVTLTPAVEEYTLFASCRDSSKFEEV